MDEDLCANKKKMAEVVRLLYFNGKRHNIELAIFDPPLFFIFSLVGIDEVDIQRHSFPVN